MRDWDSNNELVLRGTTAGMGDRSGSAAALIEEARTIGYGAMRLDTLPPMAHAQALYRSLGFREIPPYRFSPVRGTTCLELRLEWTMGDGQWAMDEGS